MIVRQKAISLLVVEVVIECVKTHPPILGAYKCVIRLGRFSDALYTGPNLHTGLFTVQV